MCAEHHGESRLSYEILNLNFVFLAGHPSSVACNLKKKKKEGVEIQLSRSRAFATPLMRASVKSHKKKKTLFIHVQKRFIVSCTTILRKKKKSFVSACFLLKR